MDRRDRSSASSTPPSLNGKRFTLLNFASAWRLGPSVATPSSLTGKRFTLLNFASAWRLEPSVASSSSLTGKRFTLLNFAAARRLEPSVATSLDQASELLSGFFGITLQNQRPPLALAWGTLAIVRACCRASAGRRGDPRARSCCARSRSIDAR
jgi:hypothetical protein